MPRIEIVPADWENSREKAAGDGTPTVDLCKRCLSNTEEGDSVEELPLSARQGHDGATVGSADVEHPPYSDDDYECAGCGVKLTGRDN